MTGLATGCATGRAGGLLHTQDHADRAHRCGQHGGRARARLGRSGARPRRLHAARRGARRGARRRGRRRPTPSSRSARTRSSCATSRPAWSASPAEVGGAREGRHLDPRRRPARRAAGRVRRHAGRADDAQRAGRGAPGRLLPRARRRRRPRARGRDARAVSPRRARSSPSTSRRSTIAMGLMSCAPAYIALVAEAQVDAGVRAGMPADVAGELVGANIAGTAALLQARGMDTLGGPPLGHVAGRLDGARPRGARARRHPRRLRRRDAGGAAAMSATVFVVASAGDADQDVPRRAADRLRPADLRLHPHVADLLLRRPDPVLALVERDPRLPARRLRAVPRRSSGASSRRSARSTSARSWPMLVLQIVGSLLISLIPE